MPEVHAILSASSSKRWLNCTPSARLEQNFPNESSVYAEEGTAAHALGEYKLRKYLHERVKRPTSEFDNEEMDANTDIYAEYIISTVERIKETCPHPLVMVEERLDYSYLVPQGFGTGDCVIIEDGTHYVMDYKNGKGVFVSCDHNPQMMLYALGAYHAYGYLYSITKVSMTIIQPRLENISTFECSVEELLDWAETYVRPRAKLALKARVSRYPATGAGSAAPGLPAKPVPLKRWHWSRLSFLTWMPVFWQTSRKKRMPRHPMTRTPPLRPSNLLHCFPRQTSKRCCLR